MIVFCSLCNNIARMGLQNTTNMRDASRSSAVLFVTILQGWVYKTQKRDACEQSDAFFVAIKTLQGWVYKTQQIRDFIDDRLLFSL